MVTVSEAALKERARQMLVDMTERARWIYALPPGAGTVQQVRTAMHDAGIAEVDQADGGRVRKYQLGDGEQHLLLFDHDKLGVVLVEARGEALVPLMQRLLDATGFVPQSKLWASALDIGKPEAVASLSTLAHMAVCWDGDWADLFILHLASPDPIVRHEATHSLVLAAMVSGDAGAGLELLKEARSRERYPKLADTMDEAMQALEAFSGAPISGSRLPEGLGSAI